MMMIVFIYLFVFQISFVSTNQLTKASSFSHISVSSEDVKQAQNRAGVPQSLTLLMNFKDDGTTSFEIMHGKFISFNWNNYSKLIIPWIVLQALFY
jgi:hypothetical protein